MTDRGFWVTGFAKPLNVRRLMYQPLIWPAVLRDEAGGLRPPLDAEDVQRLTDTLIDRVRRDVELARDLFGRPMLVDEPEAIELAGRQSVDPLFRFARHGFWLSTAVRQAVHTLQRDSSPTQHFDTTPRAPESPMSLWHPA